VVLNAPVISPAGVVGRVVRVGPKAARVQLVLDLQSGVGVRIERSRVTGVVSGMAVAREDRSSDATESGSGELTMKYVPQLADVVVGDVVVTSGLDQIFPKGLMVGRVRTVKTSSTGLFKDIVVSPSAHFERLEEVLVLQYQVEEAGLLRVGQNEGGLDGCCCCCWPSSPSRF
jgi:rod shape-determining protein MreC